MSRGRAALAAGLAAALVLAGAGCGRRAPPLPEVRVHASPDLPGEVLADAAARLRVARVVLVARAEDAEVGWLSDPAAALELGERVAPGSAPAAEGVPARFRDPRGRFAPVGARARVLLRTPRALDADPRNYRDLADPRLAGRVALVPLGEGAGPVTLAALALAYGERSAGRFAALLAGNRPQLVAREDDVRARVAAGAADAGLAGSVEGVAGAVSAAALRLVWPDQLGRGLVLLPTAAVRLRGAGPGADALLAWLAGPSAERVLVARVPGLLPLRAEVPVPPGAEPAGNLVALPLDWDALAAETVRWRAHLARWPEGGPFGD